MVTISEQICKELRSIVGDDGLEVQTPFLSHTISDATSLSSLTNTIVYPRTTQQVSDILRLAHQHALPVVTRGSDTSLTGSSIPTQGELVLSLSRMNHILEIDPQTSTATVEAGVINGDLQQALEPFGLFYPPDPASLMECSLGGNAACNAGGPRCLKYGVTKDYVLGMTVVLADGRILHLGGKVLKSAVGYQLIQLFIGSEGTLGVITELILRLLPRPKAYATAAVIFPDLDQASHAVTAIFSHGLLPTVVELMDAVTLRAVEYQLPTGVSSETGTLLLIEQDGYDPSDVQREIFMIEQLCSENGAVQVQVAIDQEEREKLWKTRRAASDALVRIRPNKLGEDIVVPRSQIPEMVHRINQIAKQFGLLIAVFGHAGDGNLHPNILFDHKQAGQWEQAEQAAAAIFQTALDLGGTLSGEHGIGLFKREFLPDALEDDVIEMMRGIKQLFDPTGLLNPGKIFPTHDRTQQQAWLLQLPVRNRLITG
jgi:glycolate oxidase